MTKQGEIYLRRLRDIAAKIDLNNRRFMLEVELDRKLYDVAKKITLKHGFPWTDPRTGETFEPKASAVKAKKRKAKR